MGEKTKWALGLGILALFCCGPVTGAFGLYFAKKDMDDARSGRAPNIDDVWASRAYYLNIVALILWLIGVCFYWGRTPGFL